MTTYNVLNKTEESDRIHHEESPTNGITDAKFSLIDLDNDFYHDHHQIPTTVSHNNIGSNAKIPSSKPKHSTFGSLIRLLSFRRKNKSKSKPHIANHELYKSNTLPLIPNSNDLNIQHKSDTLPCPRPKVPKEPSSFSKLVRSFSFLYKKNPRQDDAFKRSKSQSIHNFRNANRESSVSSPSRKSSTLNRNSRPNSRTSQVTNGNVDLVDSSKSKLGRSRPHLVAGGIDTPGVSGIQNHGNTCFINSVVQCLSNTDLLAEYFIFDNYRHDLQVAALSTPEQNRSSSPRSNGEMSEQFAILLQSIWSCMYSSEFSFKFKKVISKFSTQYVGNEQHDAQEFLLWLLDMLHEDFVTRNSTSTVIHDLFQGNLCSVVICRGCDYFKKNFEPFVCLSLPVPIRLTFTIYVNIFFCSNSPANKSGHYGVSIHAVCTLRQLRERICQIMNVPEQRLMIIQFDDKSGITEYSDDSSMIQNIFEDYETINAIETPELKPSTSNNHLSNGMCQQYLTIVWMNQVKCDRSSKAQIFGPPFTAVVSREISYNGLKANILRAMSEYLINPNEIQYEEFCYHFDITLRLVKQRSQSEDYISLKNLEHPLFVQEVEALLTRTEDNSLYSGPYHIKLMVEWDADVRRTLLVTNDEMLTIFESKLTYVDTSVDQAKECSNQNSKVCLEDCLDTYFREEKLSVDNAWMCPRCNSRQQCVKQLNIHTFPNILVVHLKRFRSRTKVNSMIEYPKNGLDLSKYVTPQKFVGELEAQKEVSLAKLIDISNSDDFNYNLYAVVCHHGTMQGGHYTAYCKNPVDSCWYYYDDVKVVPVRPNQVLTAESYILFYQKASLDSRRMHGKSPTSTSIEESCPLLKNVQNSDTLKQSNVNLNHWSFRMPMFNYYTTENYTNRCKTLPNRKANNHQQQSNSKASNYFKSLNNNNSGSNHKSKGFLYPTTATLKKHERPASRLSEYGAEKFNDKTSSSVNTIPRSRSSQRI